MVKTKEFRVVWEIDVDAADPVDAARQAEEIMRDPTGIPPVFDVYIDGERRGFRVDLAGDKPEAEALHFE